MIAFAYKNRQKILIMQMFLCFFIYSDKESPYKSLMIGWFSNRPSRM